MSVVHISDDTFESDVLQSDTCPYWWIFGRNGADPVKPSHPSSMSLPVITRIAVQIAKLDVDANPRPRVSSDVRSIPDTDPVQGWRG